VPLAAGRSIAKQGAQRADLATVVVGPEQAVVAAIGADQLLRIFQDAIAIAVDFGVFGFRIMKGPRRFDRRQFVAADAAGAYFLRAGLQIERPALGTFRQGNGQGPGIGADAQPDLLSPLGSIA